MDVDGATGKSFHHPVQVDLQDVERRMWQCEPLQSTVGDQGILAAKGLSCSSQFTAVPVCLGDQVQSPSLRSAPSRGGDLHEAFALFRLRSQESKSDLEHQPGRRAGEAGINPIEV